jgi:hypothetical protein
LQRLDKRQTSIPVKGIQQSNVNLVYTTTLKIGDQDLLVTLDTGSSDTWFVTSGFKCLNKSNKRDIAVAKCKFGKPYSKSSSFSQVTGQVFNTSYADRSFVSGIMGTEKVTIGNITIAKQPMGFVDTAAWEGDGVSSGLMGLAFPSITNAYPKGSDRKSLNIPYPPIFTNMHRQKLIAPYFSLALNRPSEGPGMLALGGLPGAPIRFSKEFAKVPMQHLSISPRERPPKGEDGFNDYMFYIVTADGFSVGGSSASTNTTKTELIIDSGSPLSYVPAAVAKAIHASWSPPVKQDRLTKQYLFNCKSTKPPRIGVKFGPGTVFFDPGDLMIVASGGLCLSGIQEAPGKGANARSILGGSFLKSVVAVFDVGAAEMRFANRIR